MAGERKFTKTHEWVMVKDGSAVIGITDHAQNALGDITYIDVTTLNDEVAQGSEMAVIESVKAASDLYAPITGVVSEVNPDLDAQPELVNQDPLEEGWIIKMTDFKEEEIDGLLTQEDYEAGLEPTEE